MYRKISLQVADDIFEQIEQLKKGRYKDKSYSEIYRLMLLRGLERTAQLQNKDE